MVITVAEGGTLDVLQRMAATSFSSGLGFRSHDGSIASPVDDARRCVCAGVRVRAVVSANAALIFPVCASVLLACTHKQPSLVSRLARFLSKHRSQWPLLPCYPTSSSARASPTRPALPPLMSCPSPLPPRSIGSYPPSPFGPSAQQLQAEQLQQQRLQQGHSPQGSLATASDAFRSLHGRGLASHTFGSSAEALGRMMGPQRGGDGRGDADGDDAMG